MTSSYDQLEGGQMIWSCARAIGRIVHSRNREAAQDDKDGVSPSYSGGVIRALPWPLR